MTKTMFRPIPILIQLLVLLPLAMCLAEATTQPAAPQSATTQPTTVIQGTIRAHGQPLPAEMVVYLEPKDSTLRFPVPTRHVQISQKGAQFSPALTVISVGQSVDFVNDEDRSVQHNVFSNAPAKQFDLGSYP